MCLTQLPTSFPPGSIILRGQNKWLLAAPLGEPIAQFSFVDAQPLTSVAPLPDGTGVLFTGPRASGLDGIFLKTGAGPATDLSISSGYHGWPAISPDGRTVVFAHHPAPDSGPIGAHAEMANAQLWALSLGPKGGSRRLTMTDGCKASPSFFDRTHLVYGHNSCRGSQGIESIETGGSTANVRVLLPSADRNERIPLVAPNRKLFLSAQMQHRGSTVSVSSWPSMKDPRVLFTNPHEQDSPSAQWTADSRFVLIVTGDEVVKCDVAAATPCEIIWDFLKASAGR